MNLPKDPVMLLSVVNTLAAINYHYDEGQNQFI